MNSDHERHVPSLPQLRDWSNNQSPAITTAVAASASPGVLPASASIAAAAAEPLSALAEAASFPRKVILVYNLFYLI